MLDCQPLFCGLCEDASSGGESSCERAGEGGADRWKNRHGGGGDAGRRIWLCIASIISSY